MLQPGSPLNGERSPRENGPNDKSHKDKQPVSPRSDGSSHASTPSSKHKDQVVDPAIMAANMAANMAAAGNAMGRGGQIPMFPMFPLYGFYR